MAAIHGPGQEVEDVERELGRGRRGLTAGQALFDLLFGVVTPPLLLWSDPGVFDALYLYDQPAALAPYWLLPAYVAVGVAGVALVLWLLTGARRPVLAMLCVGPFACGALLSLVMALKLSLVAPNLLPAVTGFLGLTPWLTAFVFARQGLRALRAGAEVSVGGIVLSLAIGTGLLLGAFTLAVRAHHRRAWLLTDLLFSRRLDEHHYALAEMLRTRAYDAEAIVADYSHLPKGDPRRERIATAYETLSGGETMASALRRMGVKVEPEGPRPAPATALAPATTPPPSTADVPR